MASRLTALLVAALAHGVAAWLPNTNFTGWGWCALAHFNHTDPAASTLNMALTGYASFYYVSLVPPGEQWTYRRDEFPKFDDGFFTASLAAYDVRTGLPIGAQYFDDVMATNNETVRKMVSAGIAMPETPREGFTAVLQRLYLDDRRLTPQELPGFLFEARAWARRARTRTRVCYHRRPSPHAPPPLPPTNRCTARTARTTRRGLSRQRT